MNKGLLILLVFFLPGILFSQTKTDTTSIQAAQAFPFMFNISTVFYTAKDSKIDKFLSKYGYAQPQQIPIGLRFEIAGMPFGSKIVYSLNAGTIISKQDIITADLSLGAYYRIIKTKKIWLLAGIALGEHFDRIVLNGKLSPSLDSLAIKYNATLSLHRTGLIVEPTIKCFWYPIQTKKFQIGLFTGIYYNLDFNSRWRVGYYPHNDDTFKNLRKPTNVGTVQEFGWVFSSGLSINF
jgi:hypothetical protein